ncbi:sensor histidine kinase [Candidatus Nitrososphaera gargensis]|uniref:sensor histidine kinase n=1 Tax=Candidatus Nitrososphaera gargensis TaxID=497727 RepID=UPI0038996360
MREHTNDAVADIGTELDTISKRIQTAASSPILLRGIDSEEARILLDATAVGMEEYVQSITYLDSNGVLLYTTEAELLDQIGSDRSDTMYYLQAKERNQPILAGPFLTENNRMSVSVLSPVFASSGSSFNGVLAAIIPIESIVDKIGQQLPPTTGKNQIFIVATDGTIIGYGDETAIGRNIFDEFRVRNEIAGRNLQLMIEGRSGVFEYDALDGQRRVAVYSPVTFSGAHTWSVLITAPASQSETFASVINDQRIFTIVAVILIGITSAILMIFILMINKRLQMIIQKQNVQIKNQLNELQDAYEKLTEQDKIKDEFINVAAHELRTPVLPIILSAEGLSEDIGTDNSKIEIILRNAKRINKLTNDILDVSRIKSNTFRLQKERTNVKKLIEEAIQDISFSKTAENKNPNLKIAFESQLPESKLEIVADRSRLHQVLANLLDNAVNFTDEGTITVSLQQNKDDPSFVEIRVADTGKGIDPSVRPRLFEKFVTKSTAKGTGLGLYLCKAIVEAHGGKIWAEDNSVGRGSVFVFTLPTNI